MYVGKAFAEKTDIGNRILSILQQAEFTMNQTTQYEKVRRELIGITSEGTTDNAEADPESSATGSFYLEAVRASTREMAATAAALFLQHGVNVVKPIGMDYLPISGVLTRVDPNTGIAVVTIDTPHHYIGVASAEAVFAIPPLDPFFLYRYTARRGRE